MRTLSTVFLVTIAVALSACGDKNDAASSDSGATPAAATPAPAATPDASTPTTDDASGSGAAAHCKSVSAPKPKSNDVPKPQGSLDTSKSYYVKLETSCGTIEIKLDEQNHPKTANVFAWLVKHGYYDHTIFHRVVRDFVVQGGDPTGTGTGGPSWSVVEPPGADASYPLGTVAMAKTQTEPAGTSSSQFFITSSESAGMPADYAIAGKVKTGREVIAAMNELGGQPPNQDGPPTQTIVLEKATLEVR